MARPKKIAAAGTSRLEQSAPAPPVVSVLPSAPPPVSARGPQPGNGSTRNASVRPDHPAQSSRSNRTRHSRSDGHFTSVTSSRANPNEATSQGRTAQHVRARYQTVHKGFSLFFFSCFIKTTITFERKVQMT